MSAGEDRDSTCPQCCTVGAEVRINMVREEAYAFWVTVNNETELSSEIPEKSRGRNLQIVAFRSAKVASTRYFRGAKGDFRNNFVSSLTSAFGNRGFDGLGTNRILKVCQGILASEYRFTFFVQRDCYGANVGVLTRQA